MIINNRELKRVPLDFDWPLNKIWKGYINPFRAINCPYCARESADNQLASHGYSKEAWEYYKTWYPHLMGLNYVRKPSQLTFYCPEAKPYTMERWEYDFILNTPILSERFFGEREIPSYENLQKWLLEKEPFVSTTFIMEMTGKYCRIHNVELRCKHCEGTGLLWYNDEVKKLHDKWERYQPPVGDGFQVWETTTEGSPQSPVFSTFDELCQWCSENITIFGEQKCSKETWMKSLNFK